MKTQFDLWRKYCTETVPMAEAAGIPPWECVRTKTGYVFHNHPQFNNNDPENYTFALAVLEGRPVFVGDRLYGKKLPITVLANEHFNLADYTWTPPTKKRTFMLGDKELPCPDKNKGGYQIALISSKHFFSDFHDAQKVANAIDEILTTARDKEGQA